MSLKVHAFIKRFLKGFIAGGMVQVVVIIESGVVVHTVEDLKKFGLALVAGFFVGGLLAVQKMMAWKEQY